MISVYRWDAAHGAAWLDASALEDESLRSGPGVCWIDLDEPTPEEEALVYEQFCKVHPLTLRDITLPRRQGKRGPHLPKVEEFRDYLFVIINPPSRRLLDRIQGKKPPADGGKALLTQLSAVLTTRVLITHHY